MAWSLEAQSFIQPHKFDPNTKPLGAALFKIILQRLIYEDLKRN